MLLAQTSTYDTIEFWMKISGAAGALTVFIIGYLRYVKDQTWKRHEFVLNEVKEFNQDWMVRNSMYMLDWGSRYIELFPNHPDYQERFAKVTRPTLRSALQSHRYKTHFTRSEVAIRDHFDCFFGYFEKFHQCIESKLLTPKELQPYLIYWIRTISTDMEPAVRNTIHHYIEEYGYTGTQQLFAYFGYDIRPETPIESTIVNEESEGGEAP